MSTLSSICYHYLSHDDEFRRIWGHSYELFKEHIDFLKDRFDIIDPKDVISEKFEEDKKYILLSFDDGLKDHVKMAGYLDKVGARGIFAVPSCVLKGEPANPQIVHFGLAYYGIRKFYDFVLGEITNNFPEYLSLLPPEPKKMDLMELHSKVKVLLKKEINPATARQILMSIFEKRLLKDFPDFMELVHLNREDIMELNSNGHTIAVHTDTHPLVPEIEGDEELMHKEIVDSKIALSEAINEDVLTFAYPFGARDELLKNSNYLTQNGYKMVLTTYKKHEQFDLLDLGRYLSFSTDSTDDLSANLWHYTIK